MDDNTTKHTFDKKAFGKNESMPLFVFGMAAFQLISVSFILSGDAFDIRDSILAALQLLAICISVYTYCIKRFVAAHSIIASSPGYVVYRKRRGGLTALDNVQ